MWEPNLTYWTPWLLEKTLFSPSSNARENSARSPGVSIPEPLNFSSCDFSNRSESEMPE